MSRPSSRNSSNHGNKRAGNAPNRSHNDSPSDSQDLSDDSTLMSKSLSAYYSDQFSLSTSGDDDEYKSPPLSPSSSLKHGSQSSLNKNNEKRNGKRRSNKSKSPTSSPSPSSSSFSLASSSATQLASRTDINSQTSASAQRLRRDDSLEILNREYAIDERAKSFREHQVMASIRDSMIKCLALKRQHKENKEAMKTKKLNAEASRALQTTNEKLADEMISEVCGVIALNQVVYGKLDWRLAWSHTSLALVYLEHKHLAEQARHHCECAWQIYVDKCQSDISAGATQLTAAAAANVAGETDTNSELEYHNEDEEHHKHQMILNYVYGRASTILQENLEGESALEKSLEHLESWMTKLHEDKHTRRLYKKEIRSWKLKIYLALAKQYAINKLYGNAIAYYDNFIDMIKQAKTRRRRRKKADDVDTGNNLVGEEVENEQHAFSDLLIEAYLDKSKIEQHRDNQNRAVDLLRESVKISERNGHSELALTSKFMLAQVFAELDDMNSCSKAEELFKEAIEGYNRLNSRAKSIEVKEELAKFHLKQDKYDDACNTLLELVKDKLDVHGDFSIKLNSTYKLLCSCYLKKSDMPRAAQYLKLSYDLEELNYGATNAKTLATKETLENLKKSPDVLSKLKSLTGNKPTFNPSKKIDYLKHDGKLFSKGNNNSN